MIGLIIFTFAAVFCVKAYGWLLLTAFIPLWILFTYFLGIPTIVNSLRTYKTFKKKELTLILLLHFLLFGLLEVILRLLAMPMSFLFLIGGLLNAWSMPYQSLIQERENPILKK